MQEAPIAQGPVDVNVRGRWEHCSPELLQAGIDCGSTPRRPCECEHGGSHDHFISDDRLEIETFDASGKRVQWWIGPTQAELEAAHLAGTCHAFCAYCITEAEALATQNMGMSSTPGWMTEANAYIDRIFDSRAR